MKTRTVVLLVGAIAALFTAAVVMAGGVPQAENKGGSESAPAKSEDTRSEAEKRAARRAANEAREKKQGQNAPNPAPREEEEEKVRKP